MGDAAQREEDGFANANGAGIAADPTLTGAWTLPLSCEASGEPSPSRLSGSALGARCLGLRRPCPKARPARRLPHRRSRRHPARWPCRPVRADPEGSFAGPKGCLPGRDRDPVWPARGGRSCQDRSPFALLPSRTGIAAFTPTLLHAILGRGGLHSTEASCIPSLRWRVDSGQRDLAVWKTLKFSALRLRPSDVSRPEDSLRLRPDRRSGKRRNPDLSTFPRFSCGERWTTQPFVALDSPDREPNRLGSRCRDKMWRAALFGYCAGDPAIWGDSAAHPPRWASRRRRSAFSLMKPSASFWS